MYELLCNEMAFNNPDLKKTTTTNKMHKDEAARQSDYQSSQMAKLLSWGCGMDFGMWTGPVSE